MMILGIPIDLMIKLCVLPLNIIIDCKLMIKLNWALWGLFLDEFWHVSCTTIGSNLQNCRWPCCLMTSRHYIIFIVKSWYLEFTSKLKQQEKQENLKKEKKVKSWHGCWETYHDLEPLKKSIRHWAKRVTMAISWHDLRNPNLGSLLHKAESWHD